jgi:hypothetical protein
MQPWLPIPAFLKKLSKHRPVSYKTLLAWVDAERLPTFPRVGQERYKVKHCPELKCFLTDDLGLDDYQVKDIMDQGWFLLGV